MKYCPNCGKQPSRYHNPDPFFTSQERKKQEQLHGESENEAVLRQFAVFYGYGKADGSLRRFMEHAKGLKEPRVLGITFDSNTNRWLFHCKPGEMRGPIPDTWGKYLEPPNLGPIDWEIYPGQ